MPPADAPLAGGAGAAARRARSRSGRVEAYPFRLAAGLTRGQAEDLLAQLTRERVAGRVCLVEAAV